MVERLERSFGINRKTDRQTEILLLDYMDFLPEYVTFRMAHSLGAAGGPPRTTLKYIITL